MSQLRTTATRGITPPQQQPVASGLAMHCRTSKMAQGPERGYISLQTVLVASVVAQILLAVGLTGWLSFLNGQKAVNSLVEKVNDETTLRIEQHVQTFLERPHLVHDLNQIVVEQGKLNVSEFEDLTKYFWAQLKETSLFSSIYYGSEAGDFVGVQHRQNDHFVTWWQDGSVVLARDTYLLDERGDRTERISTQDYDPRVRPWYTAAQDAGESTWSDIYAFASEDYPLLGITAAMPVYDDENQVQGILAIDLTLSQISDFLQDMTIGESGEAFIIERSGEVVATSSGEPPFVTVDGRQKRLEAIASQEPRIQAAAEGVLNAFDRFDAITDSRQLVLTVDGQRELIQVTPLTDERGLDWLIVVAIPESDFMGQINRNTRTTILLCALSLAVAVLIAMITSKWITRPILQLNTAAKRLAVGEWNQPMPPVRPDETGELAESFDCMRQQLRLSFEALKTANDELKQFDKLKDEFLANTSHELLTPLNGIIGLAESLADGATGQLPPETCRNLSMITSSGQRLANLVLDILDFSKLRHQDLQLQLKAIGLRVVAEVVLSLSQPLIGSKPLTLVNAISEDLPNAWVDENRLQQILHNLVSNAIKFTEEGTVTVTAETVYPSEISHPLGEETLSSNQSLLELIESPADPSGKQDAPQHQGDGQGREPAHALSNLPHFRVMVADTGVGIAADKLERIFEMFEQGNGSTARIYGGTGLGLAIARHLVELHSGCIWAESEEGKGSRFIFTLPLASADIAEYPSNPALPVIVAADDEKRPDYHIKAIALPFSQTVSQTVSQTAPGSAKEPSNTDTPDVVPCSQLVPAIPDALVPKEDKQTGDRCFKILIVDDDPINLQVLSNHLCLQHYSIKQATSGAEVFEIIEAGFSPDLILLDVMMPKMTGYEVCRQIRETSPATELPILMLTAKNQVADLVEGLNSGANDYLNKPISKNELLARIKTHLELSKASLAYARFVPYEFLKLLGHECIMDVQLGDQIQATMTVLFADIRSFTTLSEAMDPRENFAFLNSYLHEVCPIIREHNGFIDKYIGDAVMALFPQDANQAVMAAIAMQHQVAQYNAKRQAEGRQAIAIGIGIHTGSLILGTIGEEQRMESTVISDAVNLAARLEKITKLYGAGIVISSNTLAELPETLSFRHRFLDRVQPQGKSEMVEIWEVYEGDASSLAQQKQSTQPLFEKGVYLYHNDQVDDAHRIFETIAQMSPGDRATRFYLQRCQQHISDQVTQDVVTWEALVGDR